MQMTYNCTKKFNFWLHCKISQNKIIMCTLLLLQIILQYLLMNAIIYGWGILSSVLLLPNSGCFSTRFHHWIGRCFWHFWPELCPVPLPTDHNCSITKWNLQSRSCAHKSKGADHTYRHWVHQQRGNSEMACLLGILCDSKVLLESFLRWALLCSCQ